MGIKLVILSLVAALSVCLPVIDQMLLTNSLIVGRTEDLIHWICKVCDDSNKPLHSHYIEENLKDIKCILSVYPSYVVLAFRYTNSALNVWQDVLYPLQVALILFRSKMTTPAKDARSRRFITTCGRPSGRMSPRI